MVIVFNQLQNCSYVFLPIFLQNTVEIPKLMGMGHIPKILGKTYSNFHYDLQEHVILRL